MSDSGLDGGAAAALFGGAVLTSDQPFADLPAGTVFGDAYLSVGLTQGSPATLIFTGGGVDYFSFLWGSPDLFNSVTINSTGSSQAFSAGSLGLNGSQYVQFSALAGAHINSVVFSSSADSFETANFSITSERTSVVPEPANWAMMLIGFGAIGFTMRRRKQSELTFRRAA